MQNRNAYIFEHPLIQHKISIMRDKTTSTKEFRELVDEVAGLMVYEITKDLPLVDKVIETPITTMTAIRPESRYGIIDLQGDKVLSFREKSQQDVGWINGGFMVLDPKVLDYVAGDHVMFEREPMERLAADGELMCFRHDGFWQCMDTLRDKQKLDSLWDSGKAPWKLWDK